MVGIPKTSQQLSPQHLEILVETPGITQHKSKSTKPRQENSTPTHAQAMGWFEQNGSVSHETAFG